MNSGAYTLNVERMWESAKWNYKKWCWTKREFLDFYMANFCGAN